MAKLEMQHHNLTDEVLCSSDWICSGFSRDCAGYVQVVFSDFLFFKGF